MTTCDRQTIIAKVTGLLGKSQKSLPVLGKSTEQTEQTDYFTDRLNTDIYMIIWELSPTKSVTQKLENKVL